MPLQRSAGHGLTEAATQLRRCSAWPGQDIAAAAISAAAESRSSGSGDVEADGDVEAAPSSTPLPRRPSSRPLDYRWDRSRGIIFSRFNATQRRTYASRPIQRSTPTSTITPEKTTSQKSSKPFKLVSAVDSAYLTDGLQASRGRSYRETQDLENKYRALGDELTGLKARLEAQEKLLDSSKKREAETKQQLENEQRLAKQQLEQEKRKSRKQSDEQEIRHQEELDRLSPKIADYNALLNNARQEASAPLLAQIDRLEQTRAEYKTAVEEGQKQLETTKERHEALLRDAKAQTRDVNIALDDTTKELRSVQSRKQDDRADYTRYQSVFQDLIRSIGPVRDSAKSARRRVDEETEIWARSKRQFLTSANLRLFLNSSKYKSTKEAILQFLEAQVSGAQSTSEMLWQMEERLSTAWSNMGSDAHDSRALTRYHHFDDHQSAYNSADLAQRFALEAPFQLFRTEYTKVIKELEKREEAAPKGDQIEDLKGDIKAMRDERNRIDLFLKFLSYVRKWQALKALQNDDIVEKAVWADTYQEKQTMEVAVERLYDHIDRAQQSEEDWRKLKSLLQDVRDLRREYENLVAHVRKRYLLEHDLGKIEQKTERQVEKTIESKTDLAFREVRGSLGYLAGLGFRKLAARSRELPPKPTKASSATDTTTAAAATDNVDRSPPTIDALRDSLSATVSKKKRIRIATKDKNPSVLKKSPSKVKTKSSKKTTARKRKTLAEQSPEQSKPTSANAKEQAAEVEGSVSGAWVLGFKPTDPKKAQYRRPSYDTEASVERRPSRGKSMGFTLLKDALARKRPSGNGAPSEAPAYQPSQAHEAEMESSADRHGEPTRLDLKHQPSASQSQTFGSSGISPSEDTVSELEMNSSNEAFDSEASPIEAKDKAPEEPQTVLSYKIPPKDYRDAVMASPNSNAAYWSHNLYKNADNQKPTVFYCQNYDATEAKAKLFLNEPVLGFDLEWESGATMKGDPPDIKRNVSLIQIAAEDKIGLFQLSRFKTAKSAEEHMPPSLRKILESEDIIKAGVNVNGDARRMKLCLGVEMKGVFELSHMYRVVRQSNGIPVNFSLVGLSTQVQEVLLLPMKKDAVRTSAWSQGLNTQQTSYAAADAYAGFQLFHKLDNARKLMTPRPPRPAFFETMKPIILGNGTEIKRGAKRSVKKPRAEKAEEVLEDDDEEGEEFFDAPEELDTYELGPSELPAAISEIRGAKSSDTASDALPQSAGSGSGSGSAIAKQEIAYPVLHSQDPAPENVLASPAPAPSRNKTTTLPIRAKAQTKLSADPSPEEEAKSGKISASPNRPGPVPCPENQKAETWIITYRSSRKNQTIVGNPTLRAYHLWHHQHLELKEVAGFCRDPPLAMTTVASYIMQALKETDLPFDGERAKVALNVLPGSVRGRYRGVLERSG